jgi:hypothetical protein
MWRPEEYSTSPLFEKCIDECGIEHEVIYSDEQLPFVLRKYWQMIPTDENGNDILELAGGSELLKNLLKT